MQGPVTSVAGLMRIRPEGGRDSYPGCPRPELDAPRRLPIGFGWSPEVMYGAAPRVAICDA